MHIAIIGAGAVGSLVGGRLAEAGVDVTLVDGWPEHVQAMQRQGMVFEDYDGTRRIPVRALHVGDAQALHARPADIAFVCVKLYDTTWATALAAQYLAPAGYVVTLQNGLIEDVVAATVGWPRTVGCIGGNLHVQLAGPGHLRRARSAGHGAAAGGCAFYVGEAHGRITSRVEQLVQLLGQVDGAAATTNLWGLRWSKLVANCMTSALCGVAATNLRNMMADARAQRWMRHLAAEAIVTGRALGFEVEEVFGIGPDAWVAAAASDAQALRLTDEVFRKRHAMVTESAISGTAQDLAKGRRTEVEYMNGYVAARAAQAGLQAPHHAALAQMTRRIEAGTARPSDANLGVVPLNAA
jgi:2-dehydropantoate 2-reductase